MKNNGVLQNAYKIALDNLQTCLLPIGIICGPHHFTDLWARDSFFASFGANSPKNSSFTRQTVDLFLKHQLPDGRLPYRIRRSANTWGKYRGRPRYLKNPRPDFRSYQTGGFVPDGGLMTIIAAHEYIVAMKNSKFLQKNYGKLRRAMNWYLTYFKDKLINEWFMCEWADSTLKIGKTLYTNALYFKALSDMADMAKMLKQADDGKKYTSEAIRIKKKIQDEFWSENYFGDWIDYKKHKYFSSMGNMLAVWFGIADKNQAEKIFNFADKNCWNEYVLEENFPKYPWRRILFWNFLIGMGDYHNRGCMWLQPGLFYVLALTEQNKSEQAKLVLVQIAKLINKNNGVFEVYEKNWQPLKRFFYTAEHPFAWSAGLFVYAYRLLQKI